MANLSKPGRVLLTNLEYVGSFDWDQEQWQFNITQVWKEARGRYFVASDSGCSCPQPFEDINYTDECAGPYNKTELRAYFERALKAERGRRPQSELRQEISKLLAKLT
ncbi:hypothetical protein SEA_DAUBENSKI_261 [Streptomyces phage Daubenski]|uniref:DUF7574 domain-containing protein n=1 Tax=Streptomyces phage Daubenski TaxID=2653725 RepID=A0A5Q2WG03_9CAUD|nr:hypothetical protein KNU80_gp017 [Streptomyces phage Daubenski]YP_010104985.1 hypothetical protein KNU80_gp044 [Streptomyces phage Daubenski]QGH76328.1 hypothetical protein SEA_DAUBENSKI_17 [Streptomyces phage Daubenski]QGH76526.1 hypothetical protein SEA_DAUBENSKI_261 [Streptomyces phage Daubenski]